MGGKVEDMCEGFNVKFLESICLFYIAHLLRVCCIILFATVCTQLDISTFVNTIAQTESTLTGMKRWYTLLQRHGFASTSLPVSPLLWSLFQSCCLRGQTRVRFRSDSGSARINSDFSLCLHVELCIQRHLLPTVSVSEEYTWAEGDCAYVEGTVVCRTMQFLVAGRLRMVDV